MGRRWIVLPNLVLLGVLFHRSGSTASTDSAGLYQAGGCRVLTGPSDPNRPKCCDGWELVHGNCLPVCPRGYARNRLSSCYKLIPTPSSWEEARHACRQNNRSDLVIVDSKEELNLLVQLGRDLQLVHLWIGLREAPLVRSLVWVDGSLVTADDDLTPLLPQTRPRPAHAKTTANPLAPSCVALDLWSGALVRRDCAKPSTFVCEVRPQCPRGFEVDFKRHCYRYVTQRTAPWNLARSDCRKAPGGELAIVAEDPGRESQHLLRRVQPSVSDLWIGLYNEAPSGVWKWVDGTALTETQSATWNSGQVRNLRGYGNCVGISSNAGWSNTDCNQNLSYVCEIQENGECYTATNGVDYRGHVNITAAGGKCSNWNRESLSALNVSDADWLTLEGHNYCRNPGGGKDSAWCMENRQDGSLPWKPCYIGEPQMSCVQGFQPTPRSFATPCTDRHTCDRGHTCHPVIRECICPSGFQGNHCRRPCPPGRFGYQCDFTCLACSGGEPCHHVTGECPHHDSTDVTESLGGNQAIPCGGICPVADRVGCVCDSSTGSCPCPAYVVALLAIVIVTWIVLGFSCLACGIIRRRRNRTRVEYKRDSDYCEEIGSDSDTDGELENQQISGHPTSEIVPTPAVGTAVGVMDNFESSTAVLLHDLPQGRPSMLPSAPPLPVDSPPDESPPPSPFYLNVTRYRDETEYSDPYELLGREPIWRRSAPGPDEVWEPFLFRPATDQEELNNAPNGYVNDSVIKLKQRRRSNRSHHVPYKLRFSFRSKELEHKAVTSAAGETHQHKRTFKQKPPLKPKPENIKLRPFGSKGSGCIRGNCTGSGTLSRRSDPQTSTTRRDELELQILGQHSPAISCHSATGRRHKFQRGTSVPNAGTCCQGDPDLATTAAPWPWREEERSEGHVYVNEKIGRPRVAKARSVDEFGA